MCAWYIQFREDNFDKAMMALSEANDNTPKSAGGKGKPNKKQGSMSYVFVGCLQNQLAYLVNYWHFMILNNSCIWYI